MSLNSDRYTYRITWSEDDREFVGLCIEFPSLSWLAKNPEAALRGIRRVVRKAVLDMENDGESAPTPISGKSYSGKFVVRIPPEVHRALAIKAAEEGISLNRLVSARLTGLPNG
jgi:predicted HicB family RNase H-like nuclease